MRTLSVLKKSQAVELLELKAYEDEFNLSLPVDYKEFLLKSNPIDVAERVMRTAGHEYHMDRFFPFDKSDELSLQSVNVNLSPTLSCSCLSEMKD